MGALTTALASFYVGGDFSDVIFFSLVLLGMHFDIANFPSFVFVPCSEVIK